MVAGAPCLSLCALVERHQRGSLAIDRRFSRLWPVEEGLVEAAVWDEVADRITTRSTVWRFVIAVGIEPEAWSSSASTMAVAAVYTWQEGSTR